MSNEIPNEWRNCYLVLHTQDDTFNYDKKVTYCKPIVRAQDKDRNILDFYGVVASKFGIAVPAGTTHWAVAVLGVARPCILFEGKLPDPLQVVEVDVDDTQEIAIIRYNRNIKFSIGQKHSLRSKKSSKTIKEDAWTVEESLELLFG